MDRRYPIGQHVHRASHTPESRAAAVRRVAVLPQALRAAVQGVPDVVFDTPYREGGWTMRQVVHHLPDSHMNAFIRLKLALTEHDPIVKPYDEEAWSRLEDAKSTPISVSLDLMDGIHDRMVRVLQAMVPADFTRRYLHPVNGPTTLDQMLELYAWHGDHHVGHCRLVTDEWARRRG